MKNLFFTSDIHCYHKNIIKYDNRPFTCVDEMNQTIINNWNNKISDDDDVYYLGDLSFTGFEKTKEFVDKLKGNIHFICGNHDNFKNIVKLDRFDTVEKGYMHLWVDDLDAIKGKQQICMSHYPMIVWDRHHNGSYHLHGHCHGSLMNTDFGKEYYKRKVIDVGCNIHNYTPLSYLEVKDIMRSRDVITIDHHA